MNPKPISREELSGVYVRLEGNEDLSVVPAAGLGIRLLCSAADRLKDNFLVASHELECDSRCDTTTLFCWYDHIVCFDMQWRISTAPIVEVFRLGEDRSLADVLTRIGSLVADLRRQIGNGVHDQQFKPDGQAMRVLAKSLLDTMWEATARLDSLREELRSRLQNTSDHPEPVSRV